MIQQCSRQHCGAIATCQPVVCIPAQEGKAVLKSPVPNFYLCTGHMNTANSGEFLTLQTRNKISRACRGGAKPNFRKAYLEIGPNPNKLPQ